MKSRTHLKLKQLGIIICAWLVVGLLMSIYDHLVLLTANSQGPAAEYSFLLSALSNLGSALMGALLGGSFMVFYINEYYQDKPYGYTIMAVMLAYIVVILLIIAALGMLTIPLKTGKPLSDPVTKEALKVFLTDSSRLKNVMTWSLVVALTQLLLQINSKFGPGTFISIALGRYNTARTENKIFMFLDLNSSTAIAEQLGDERYHDFLKDFFADITNPILDNKGEIYQYVGDEVVIAWKYEQGLHNSRCIQCFFDIKQQIALNKEKYLQRYGIVPSFKAGVHYGKVVAGEVGIIKRDITYSGDVLNTAARILSLCREYNVEIIASAELLSQLYMSSYTIQPLGFIRLRGKEKAIMLNAISLQRTSHPVPADIAA